MNSETHNFNNDIKYNKKGKEINLDRKEINLDRKEINLDTEINKIKKIKANTDIEINGRIYFVPDKIIGNAIFYLSTEHKQLYKIIFAMYLDSLITNYKIESIVRITKNHITDANLCADKLISYILTGKVTIINLTNLTIIEKQILDKVPEYLSQNINPNIIEKIDV